MSVELASKTLNVKIHTEVEGASKGKLIVTKIAKHCSLASAHTVAAAMDVEGERSRERRVNELDVGRFHH